MDGAAVDPASAGSGVNKGLNIQLEEALGRIDTLQKSVVEKDGVIRDLSITNMKQYAMIEALEAKVRELNFVIGDKRGKLGQCSPQPMSSTKSPTKETPALEKTSSDDSAASHAVSYLDWNARRKEAEDIGQAFRKFPYSISDMNDFHVGDSEFSQADSAVISRQSSVSNSGSSTGRSSIGRSNSNSVSSSKLPSISPVSSRSRSISPPADCRDKETTASSDGQSPSPVKSTFSLFSSRKESRETRDLAITMLNRTDLNSPTAVTAPTRSSLFDLSKLGDDDETSNNTTRMSSTRVEPPSHRTLHDRDFQCPPLPAKGSVRPLPKSQFESDLTALRLSSARNLDDVNVTLDGSPRR
jgi:hypothetical protein